MIQKAILVFQALVGSRKKSTSLVRYATKLEGALCLVSNTPPGNNSKCTRRSCGEVNVALDVLLGCLTRKYL